MPFFVCKLCMYKVNQDVCPSQCPSCGAYGEKYWEQTKVPPLILEFEGKKLIVLEDEKELGRDSFRIFGEMHKYVSTPQCHLARSPNCWRIRGYDSAVNDTLLNGTRLGEEQKDLHSGDNVTIGPIQLQVKVRND